MTDKREMVVESSTGQPRPIGTCQPLLCSAELGWHGYHLEQHTFSGVDTPEIHCQNHIIVLHLNSVAALEMKESGRLHQTAIQPGQVNIHPAQLPYSIHSPDSGEFVLVSLEPGFLTCAAHELEGLDRLELCPKLGADDALIKALILGLKAEVENGGAGGRTYSESLATALATHLAYKHSAQRTQIRQCQGGLSKFHLREVIDYMQEHLAEDISLETLAGVVGLSSFHFCRMFKQSTGLTPHNYVVRCRVTRAKQLLLMTDDTIATVATKVGFCDQSHLATHFKRVYGVTPKAFMLQKASHVGRRANGGRLGESSIEPELPIIR